MGHTQDKSRSFDSAKNAPLRMTPKTKGRARADLKVGTTGGERDSGSRHYDNNGKSGCGTN